MTPISAPISASISAPISLYIHIPFCGTRCTYCAFNTYTTLDAHIPAYVAAVCNELRWLGPQTSAPVHTIFFGGGTPSLLTADQVRTIINTVTQQFDLSPNAEITLEVNPGSVDAAYFAALRATGVNRLSIGMQSVHAGELALFQRDHGVAAVPRTMTHARTAGFDNISVDVIYGIPDQTLSMWEQTLSAALAQQPQHISMYALQLEAGTPLAKQVDRGLLPRPDDDLAADMYELADSLLSAADFEQYEISNWAQLGRECRHNLQYWRNLPYLGVGAGAHGYAGGVRYEVVRPPLQYIELANAQTAPMPFPFTATVSGHEPIDQTTAMAEHLMTGLRLLREGISLRGFRDRFGCDLESVYGAMLTRFVDYEMLLVEGDTVRLTPRARLLSNQIFVELFPA